jgi:hypothetical protein
MSDGFKPPQGVQDNAKRGLELRREFNRGGTEVGVARARSLSNGQSIPLETVRRMVSYFARHEVDKKGKDWGNTSNPSAGYIAWLLWGGDAGKTWANSISEREKKDKSMTTDMTSAYAAIIKQEKQADGTLLVYGKATDDSIDSDNQICDAAWLETAMPQWFKTGGNIREQHSNIAAGVAKEYEAKSDGHYIQTLIVDPNSVKKVETGVLKGFSIGIRAPRVVRDQKAANGRIIDGQIVEISLVDRPANPNAKLMLAKSIDGESTLVQVEEFESKFPTPADIFKKETDYSTIIEGGGKSEPADKDLYSRVKAEAKKKFDVYPSAVANAWIVQEYKKRGGTYQKKTEKTITPRGVTMIKADEIIEQAKGLAPDTVKFDQAAYEAARKALAQLIVVEATEMAETGSNEKDSIECLLDAVKHLFNWYEGETEEGETPDSSPMMQLADKPDEEKANGCDCECDACLEDKGCDSKMCKCGGMAAGADAEKSTHKCLECGCDQPTNDHGRSDVTTAEMQELKSSEPDSDVSPSEESEEVAVSDEAVEEEEIESVKSALKAEIQKVASLQTELEAAKALAVTQGQPKRFGKKFRDPNELVSLAAQYRAKALASTDPTLVKGYTELAEDFLAKSKKSEDE